MTEFEDALELHMASIVFDENRPFCVQDFLNFEWQGKEFRPNSGTIRNKFSEFKHKGIIELDYKTNIAYYTLKGHVFGKKPMTPYPAGVTISHNHPMYKILEGLVLDKASFHNVHMKFTLPNVYNVFSNTAFPRIERSKQIVFPWWKKNNVTVRTVISKTDTVSMTIACSLQPIPLDFKGFNYFSLILGNIAGRLQTHLDMLQVNHKNIYPIPD